MLGKGNLPSIPLVVKAKFFSKEVRNDSLSHLIAYRNIVACNLILTSCSHFLFTFQAEKKIKAAGGAVLLTA